MTFALEVDKMIFLSAHAIKVPFVVVDCGFGYEFFCVVLKLTFDMRFLTWLMSFTLYV